MNNKGFAISGIIYGILIMFLLLVFSMLAMLVNRKISIDKIKENAMNYIINNSSDFLPEINKLYVPKKNIYFNKEAISYLSSYDYSQFAIAPYNDSFYVDTTKCDFSSMQNVGDACVITYSLINSDESLSIDANLIITDRTIENNFDYTGRSQDYTFYSGIYKLEVWGASGGQYGGRGGYSTGILDLSEKIHSYVYVGGKGKDYSSSNLIPGGFNGGGASLAMEYRKEVSSGGGGTDIRLINDSLYSRVIVAGGGGGGEKDTIGLAGGGTDFYDYYSNTGPRDYAGGECYNNNESETPDSNYIASGFGIAGGAKEEVPGFFITGGGSGFYGAGYSKNSFDYSWPVRSGGGTGYVFTTIPDITGWLLDSSYFLTSAETIHGDESFPSVSKGIEEGHSGNGYARISKLIFAE